MADDPVHDAPRVGSGLTTIPWAVGVQPAAWVFLTGLLCCLVGVAAQLAGAHNPIIAQHFLLLSLGLALTPRLLIGRWPDAWTQRWFVVALIALLYLVAVQVTRGAPHVAWWRTAERTVALGLCLAAATSALPAVVAIRLLGAGAAVVVLIGVLATLGAGPFHRGPPGFHIGMGGIHVLGETTAPALIAWAVWLAITTWRERRWSGDWLLLVPALIAEGSLAVGGARRGLALAALAVSAWLLLCLLYRRWPRLARAAAVIGGIGLVGLALWVLFGDQANAHDIRLLCYRAAFETGARGLPWGSGSYGILAMPEIGGEHARHLGCLGWVMHAHNEFLDAWIDGGMPLTVLALVLTGGVIWRVNAIIDLPLRRACQCLGLALLVHAMTDNVYGLFVGQCWAAVAVGTLFLAPAALPTWTIWPLLRRPWPLALPVVATAAFATAAYAPLPWVSRHAPASEHAAMARRSWDIFVISAHANAAINRVLAGESGVDALRVLDDADGHAGRSNIVLAQRLRWASTQPVSQQLPVLLTTIGRYPHLAAPYQRLTALLRADPGLEPQIPPRVLQRMIYAGGRADLPAPSLDRDPVDLDEAIDLLFAIEWTVRREGGWATSRRAIRSLCAGYGDISTIACLALRGLINAPDGAEPDLTGLNRPLRRGLLSADLLPVILGEVATTAQAKRVLPLLTWLFPDRVDAARAGISELPLDMPGDEVHVQCQVLRITALADRVRPLVR